VVGGHYKHNIEKDFNDFQNYFQQSRKSFNQVNQGQTKGQKQREKHQNQKK